MNAPDRDLFQRATGSAGSAPVHRRRAPRQRGPEPAVPDRRFELRLAAPWTRGSSEPALLLSMWSVCRRSDRSRRWANSPPVRATAPSRRRTVGQLPRRGIPVHRPTERRPYLCRAQVRLRARHQLRRTGVDPRRDDSSARRGHSGDRPHLSVAYSDERGTQDRSAWRAEQARFIEDQLLPPLPGVPSWWATSTATPTSSRPRGRWTTRSTTPGPRSRCPAGAPTAATATTAFSSARPWGRSAYDGVYGSLSCSPMGISDHARVSALVVLGWSARRIREPGSRVPRSLASGAEAVTIAVLGAGRDPREPRLRADDRPDRATDRGRDRPFPLPHGGAGGRGRL